MKRFVISARTRSSTTCASVERLKAVCQLEGPLFDAELRELISHVVARTIAPPRSVVRVAALRRQSRVLQERLSSLFRKKVG